jgi:hypothetical protein
MAPAKDNQVVVDLTGYRDSTSAHVPPGVYTVVVEHASQSMSKQQNPMITTWLDITEGSQKGQTLVDRLVLSEKSLFRVVGFLKALGVPTPKKRLALNLASLVGHTLQVEVDDGDPYRGKVNSEVRGYMRANEKVKTAPADLPDDEDEDDEDEAEEATVEETPAPKAKKAKKAKPAPEPADDDDDDEDEVDLESIDLR